jgi:hypothetical protein
VGVVLGVGAESKEGKEGFFGQGWVCACEA